MREKIVVCWSGGKDSAMALYKIQKTDDYEVVCLLTTVTEGYNRISMHGVRNSLLDKQTQSIGLPLNKITISKNADNAEYENKMKDVLLDFKRCGVSSVVFGDIFLEDLRKYREDKLASVGLKAIFPIWMSDTKWLIESFINLGFKSITTCIDSKKLSKEFCGRLIDRNFLKDIPPKIDPCGENGEFHSFVFDGPLFKKRIDFTTGRVILRDGFYFCELLP